MLSKDERNRMDTDGLLKLAQEGIDLTLRERDMLLPEQLVYLVELRHVSLTAGELRKLTPEQLQNLHRTKKR